MGIAGIICLIIGVLLAGSAIGIIFSIPFFILGFLLCGLAILKGGISALFSLGSSKKE